MASLPAMCAPDQPASGRKPYPALQRCLSIHPGPLQQRIAWSGPQLHTLGLREARLRVSGEPPTLQVDDLHMQQLEGNAERRSGNHNICNLHFELAGGASNATLAIYLLIAECLVQNFQGCH